MIKYVLPLLMLVSVTACESSLDVSTAPVQITYAQPAAPSPVTMLPVNWALVTKDNIDTFVAQAKANTTTGPVFVSISTGDYQNMILNVADLRRYIEQQQAIIVYYKNITTNTPPVKTK